MPEYTIAAVSPETRPWKSQQYGDFIAYKIKFEGSDDAVELSQKVSTDAPVAGQTLEGEISDNGDFGKKFKKAYSGGSGGGGGGKSPGEQVSIEAQSALKSAARAIQGHGDAPSPAKLRELTVAGFEVIQECKSAEGKAETQPPADGQGSATPAQAGSDADIPF